MAKMRDFNPKAVLVVRKASGMSLGGRRYLQGEAISDDCISMRKRQQLYAQNYLCYPHDLDEDAFENAKAREPDRRTEDEKAADEKAEADRVAAEAEAADKKAAEDAEAEEKAKADAAAEAEKSEVEATSSEETKPVAAKKKRARKPKS